MDEMKLRMGKYAPTGLGYLKVLSVRKACWWRPGVVDLKGKKDDPWGRVKYGLTPCSNG